MHKQKLRRRCGSGFSVQNLRRMRHFYLDNRKRSAPSELPWAHQVELMPLGGADKRERLEKKAIREKLTSRQLRELVRIELIEAEEEVREKPAHHKRPKPVRSLKLLTPLRGRLYTYRIVKKGGVLYVDRGFRNYEKVAPSQAGHLKEGGIVEELPGKGLRRVKDAVKGPLFTYEADLDRVTDGDTQWYFIYQDQRPGRGMRNDKLRLRGIDCPELKKVSGRAAKRFAEAQFAKAQSVILTTTKPDKYDRYLTDVFLKMKDGTEVFLNNLLLETGHAVRYDDVKEEDWNA